ncbi:flagellar hook-associated protein FlgL [Uliginosibacterium gangwonense]|uniref:flagellar hook-associated protein FlgL n=1 Tax=Uliginosibacterium gangwonense TaxID=392736 RepID=UPI00037B46FC|nr:flagellar hook-associated protein FlgL [Uliginosibacterium gangwonense]
MRISTPQLYNTNVSNLTRQQSDLVHSQQQLSTGKRVLTPADDPVAAARALEVGQSVAINSAQATTQGTATDSLKQLDSRLSSINDILTYIHERAVQAGSGTLNQADRDTIATDVAAQFDELMSQANTVDPNGEYVFAGYKGDQQPFVGNLAGVTYQGDQGSRSLQVSNSRQIPIGVNGNELFMNVDDGAGGVTDTFSIISNLVSTIKNSGLSSSAYSAAIEKSMGQLNNAQDNVLRLQSQTGSRMVELDALTSMGENLNTQYASTLNTLVGLDYISTISTYQQQNTYLEASRSTFSKVSGLSLFNYLGG